MRPETKTIVHRILIHPGASRAYKQWTFSRFEELAEQLVARGFEVVWITQNTDDKNRLPASVIQKTPSDLKSFVNDLASAELFVDNNSGPMNLANALGIPSVIFSGPSPEKWAPYWHREHVSNLRVPDLRCQPCDPVSGPVNACQNCESPMACMNGISVDFVIQEIERLLKS